MIHDLKTLHDEMTAMTLSDIKAIARMARQEIQARRLALHLRKLQVDAACTPMESRQKMDEINRAILATRGRLEAMGR